MIRLIRTLKAKKQFFQVRRNGLDVRFSFVNDSKVIQMQGQVFPTWRAKKVIVIVSDSHSHCSHSKNLMIWFQIQYGACGPQILIPIGLAKTEQN